MGYVSKIKVPSGTSYDIKDSNALPKSGGTMTGALTLAADPTADYQAATKHYVDTSISNIPEPMIFKGTLGAAADNPTITSLPTAAATNKGYTYKVITAGTYASQAAKVGDVFISDGSDWVLIPAGDDVEDTWRNIKVNGTEKLGTGISSGGVDFVNGSNTTVSFNSTGNKITVNSNGAGSTNSTSKLYLIGAASQGANPQTYSHSQVYETDGTLYLIKETNASGTANNKPALIIGGTDTSTHLEFDANEIMAKANGTTPSTLYLNKDGGAVNIGPGGLNISGEFVLTAGTTSAEIYDDGIVDITVSDSNHDYKGQLELVEGSATIRGDGPSNKYCYISANYDGINIVCYDSHGSQGYTINSQGIYQGSTNIYDVIKNTVEQIAPEFDSSTTYSLGDYCIDDNKLYCYTSSTPSSGNWDSTKWTQTTVAAELNNKVSASVNGTMLILS